ncbi:MAG: hypothetical protein H0T92_11230 [Pyrinomonadaceae bacterium]|nr:hypothetical protein [Pyrinomonadaceae bacterium]
MKRPTPLMLLCAVLCCLAFARPAGAQYGANIYVDSFVYIDHENGLVHGAAYASADYAYGCNYGIDLTADLESEDGSQFTWDYYIGENYASVHLYLAAYADTEYTIQADYDVNVYYSYEYYGYYDPNNFYYWVNQQVNAFGPFNFFGPGPETFSSPYFRLGRNRNKNKSRKPHHLWLVEDRIGGAEVYPPGYQTCGQVFRRLTFYVVDEANRRVGRALIREHVPNPPTDSCSGATVVYTGTTVDLGPYNTIIDYVNTGCNQTTGGSAGGNCGFTSYPGYFQWVPRSGAPPVNLATFHRDVRYNYIGINGVYTEYPIDAQFFP